jgi:hypothetical protein
MNDLELLIVGALACWLMFYAGRALGRHEGWRRRKWTGGGFNEDLTERRVFPPD